MRSIKFAAAIAILVWAFGMAHAQSNDEGYYTNIYDIKNGDIVYFEGEQPINYDYGDFTYFHHDRKKTFRIRVKYYKRVVDVNSEFFGMEGEEYPVIKVEKVYEPDCEIPSVMLGPWTLRPTKKEITYTRTREVNRVAVYPAYKKKKKKVKTVWYWQRGEKPIGILKKYSGQ